MFLIILTNAGKWLSGRCVGCVSLGPGFDSQVPPNVSIIFLYRLPCRLSNVLHHIPPNISMPCVLKQQSSGHEVMTMVLSVNQQTPDPESQTCLNIQMGPELLSNLQKAQHTPWFSISFFYFLPFYFLLIIIITMI